MSVCVCEHEATTHTRGAFKCRAADCRCSLLRPPPGKRPEFGVHRLPPKVADSAPAWDPAEIERARTAELRKKLRA